MAPLPPDNTARAFVTYQVDGRTHTLCARLDGAMSDGDASENISDFLSAMSPLVGATVFVKFERSDLGSNVRVPAVWGGITTWGSGGSGDDETAPLFWSFTGKSADGRAARVELFGRNIPPDENWRLPRSADTSVDAALAALETTDAIFNSISDVGVIWNQYANESISQHWVGQARK